MKKFLIITFLMTLMAGLFLNAPVSSIDTGNQVTYVVDNQTIDLPATPVISSICLADPPTLIYTCGVSTDNAANFSFKNIWAWLSGNWWWIASALLTISEGLGLSKNFQSNSIFQLIYNFLKKKAVKPT